MKTTLNELEQALADWKLETPSTREDTAHTEQLIETQTREIFTEWVTENCSYDVEVYEAYQENIGDNLLDVADWFTDCEDAYAGEWRNNEEFAENLLEETEDLSRIPDLIRYNIDWSGLARDLMNDYFEVNGHYFLNQ